MRRSPKPTKQARKMNKMHKNADGVLRLMGYEQVEKGRYEYREYGEQAVIGLEIADYGPSAILMSLQHPSLTRKTDPVLFRSEHAALFWGFVIQFTMVNLWVVEALKFKED